jgi:tetratricopeptide (TPR) repeat protein
MSSIIEGYNYDIFISYRQKDNKGDRWVSEFVEALKTELESTFKEEISVYFDINPHDGLLETHDVDASLKDKLKCLIFIPIISRTYCDPKSFAWEHEFKAFVEQASQDQFGLKVKLPNRNVATRVLPVRIYDLDTNDIKLCESILGGVLRGVDFIYKSAGVNRPLRSKEENPQDNLNHTIFRDQINKVGNAIKEVFSGLKTEPEELGKEKTLHIEPLQEVKKEPVMEVHIKPAKLTKRKLLTGGIVFALLLIIAAVVTYPKIIKRNTLERLRSSGERISIAVMPFQNMTNDTTKNIWQSWIQNNLINLLSNSDELAVRPTELIDNLIESKGLSNYSSLTTAIASSISKKLDADVLIYGSIGQVGPTIRIYAQLIDSKTKEVFKSFQKEISSKKEMNFWVIDSLSMKVKDFLEVSKLKRESPINLHGMLSTVNSPEAYHFFIAGKKAFEKKDFTTVIDMLSKSIAIDSNFTYAPILLAQAYWNAGMYDSAKKLVLEQYHKRELMPLLMKTYTNWIYTVFFETPYEQIWYINQLLGFDDYSPDYHYLLASAYFSLYQYDNAIPELEKALAIYNRWATKPWWVGNYTSLGYAYHKTGQYKKEKKLYKKAEIDFPNDPDLIYRQAILSLTERDTITANQYMEKYRSIRKENLWSEASVEAGLAGIYSEAGVLDKAEEYYRLALAIEPERQVRLNNLAYFLIDKGRNITEGLELIDKSLINESNNYASLNCKGWGLYKQEKYQEAFDILQKSWDLRMRNAIYNHEAFLHLEEAKKAVASQKKN